MNNYNENLFEYSLFNRILFVIFCFFGNILAYNFIFFKDDGDHLSRCADELHATIQNDTNIVKQITSVVPYEEKYLTKLRNMKNEYVFSDEEMELQEKKFKDLEEEERKEKLESIYMLNEKIEELNLKLSELNKDSKQKMIKDDSIIRKICDSIQNEINIHKQKIMDIQENTTPVDEFKKHAQQYIIDTQLKTFNKKFIIEHTPLGNVLMFYNHEKLAFEYYSDLTIPYRYLETVARKYVLTYDYRPLYIDMEEELKEYERKLQEKEKEKEKEKEREKEKEDNKTVNSNSDLNKSVKPKDVFAKFKSYNKEAGSGRVNTAPPPKNSIPQNRIVSSNLNDGSNNEKMLLKENANRYSYQGKFSNFNILQKINRKVVDKKYALSFADFKKMKSMNLIS
jgi:hypothetical protein